MRGDNALGLSVWTMKEQFPSVKETLYVGLSFRSRPFPRPL